MKIVFATFFFVGSSANISLPTLGETDPFFPWRADQWSDPKGTVSILGTGFTYQIITPQIQSSPYLKDIQKHSYLEVQNT